MILSLLTGCKTDYGEIQQETSNTSNDASSSSGIETTPLSSNISVADYDMNEVNYDDEDFDGSYDESSAVKIVLEGNSAAIQGEGASADNGAITISLPGTYLLLGKLDDGQIIVDSSEEGTVRLILAGADITSLITSPLYIKSADKTIITLADNTQNYITDTNTENYVFDDEEKQEPNAAIFSKDNLVINGSGSLTVNANYNNGISGNDYLKITGGNIIVNAADGGIRGKNFIAVRDGNVIITAQSDGLYSTNDTDEDKGYISIEGGIINITSGNDGIQASSLVYVSGGDITINSGGGSANTETRNFKGFGEGHRQQTNNEDESASAKGIKATQYIYVSGGNISIDSADDSMHSNDTIAITGGTFSLSSGDDGMHADSYIQIDSGNILIVDCYEGLEASNISLNGGDVHINASDDGINIAGGSDDTSSDMPMRQDDFAVLENCFLTISGGYIYINAYGDGLDSNGSMDMTGGTVLVSGPVNSGNGALDYNGTCSVTGGLIAAAGSSGMAMAPSSGQNSVLITLPSMQQAGTMISIVDENGLQIFACKPQKEYQTLMLSTSDLTEGVQYTVYLGGQSSGTSIDGLYTDGDYSSGTKAFNFTMQDNIIYVSESGTSTSGGGTMPGGGQGGPNKRH